MPTPPSRLEVHARRAVLRAVGLLRLACGIQCAAEDAEIDRLRLELARCREQITILQARLARIEPRHRPRYTADHRFQILTFAHQYGLSFADAARTFVVDVGTIARWASAVASGLAARVELVWPAPPVQRFADVVRYVVQRMDQMGFGGNRLIAATLARAGWRLSRETVRRIRRERRMPAAPPPASARAILPRSPNHVWFLDLTTIAGAWRLWSSTLAVVFDGHARFPVVAQLFRRAPTAPALSALVDRAVARYGAPRVLVTDQAAQFTARVFRRGVRANGIRHRFGAVGRTGSIARIERFWRTLKERLGGQLLRPARFSTRVAVLQPVLRWYTWYRPHTALAGRTPAERYFGRLTTAPLACRPPRGRPGEHRGGPPFEFAWFDADRSLPILRGRARRSCGALDGRGRVPGTAHVCMLHPPLPARFAPRGSR